MRILPGPAAFLMALGACSSSEPSVPGAVTLSPGSVSLTALGQTQALSATVRDQHGDLMSGVTLNWSTTNPTVASVSQAGVVTAHSNGSAEVTATAGAASGTAEVTVVQTASQLIKFSGDEQTGPAGQPLFSPLVVQANDALGNPVAGAPLIFTVTQGGGSVAPTNTSTAANGRASTTFTLGTAAAVPQEASAGLVGTTVLVSFSATGTASAGSYDITLRYTSSVTTSQEQAFDAAKARWQSLITGDLQNGLLQTDAGDCGDASPALNEQVDDVLILVLLEPIDGVDGTLGQAGPCFVRTSDGLTVLGLMRFDTDDLDFIEAEGLLQDLFVHEMGHVLGFGTLWNEGLLAEPALGIPPGVDPHFTGAQAIGAFNAVGGSAYPDAKVPVEDIGGVGTADTHWRESVFANELMTGFIDTQNPLSSVTVASLGDLGYLVNTSPADSYTLPSLLARFARAPARRLENDILRVPIKKVDSRGRVTGVLRR